MRLSVRHITRYEYEPPALRSSLRLKLFPQRFETQAPQTWAVTVNGEPVTPQLANSLGEGEATWTSGRPLSAIEIVAAGVVETGESAGVVRGLKEAARPTMYLRETPLTAPDDAIRALGGQARDESVLVMLHNLSNGVRDAVDYVKRSTAHSTPAAQALSLGAGVCQDHAHIFIAAARALGVPARYVTGYLIADAEGPQETHAWAEAFAPDLGWVGFDPSNRQSPTEAYIRLCAGFDAADAAPVRGTVSGGAEGLSVHVDVAQAQQ